MVGLKRPVETNDERNGKRTKKDKKDKKDAPSKTQVVPEKEKVKGKGEKSVSSSSSSSSSKKLNSEKSKPTSAKKQKKEEVESDSESESEEEEDGDGDGDEFDIDDVSGSEVDEDQGDDEDIAMGDANEDEDDSEDDDSEEDDQEEGNKNAKKNDSKQVKKDDNNNSREAHAKQKVLLQERKAAKPNSNMITRSKQLWERLRRKSHVPLEERKKLIAELFQIITGRTRDFVFKHDSVRVIQTALKYANVEQRKQIARELQGSYNDLAQSRYAKFLVGKLIVHGDVEIRDMIVPEFYGHVRKLIKHPEACWILDDIYRTVATKDQRANLLREWYGPEFVIFREDNGKRPNANLSEILAEHPEKRTPIMHSLYELINQLVQKQATGFTILHDAMLQYYLNTKPGSTEASGFVELLKNDDEGDLVKNLAFTPSGSRLMCLCLAYSDAKGRKQLLRFYRDTIKIMAGDLHAHLVLLAAYEVVDDTKLTSKMILSELLSQGSTDNEARNDELLLQVTDLNTRIPVLYPFVADKVKWLLPEIDHDIIKEIREIRKGTSKKDPAARRQELIKAASPTLLDCMAARAVPLMETSFGCQFIAEVLFEAEGDKQKALSAVAVAAKSKSETKDSAFIGRMLKSLVQGGRFNSTTKTVEKVQPPLNFHTLLYEQIKDEIMAWATGPNIFVVVALAESEEFGQRDELIQTLKKNKKALEQAAASSGTDEKKKTAGPVPSGAKLLLEKLMEGNLNRARSTMRLTPSISPTPSSSGSSSPLGFHQPAGGLYRSISTSNRRAPPVRTRYNSNSSVDANRRPHSRVHSETILPPYLTDPGQISRSVSAMGSDTSSFRHDDRSFRYEPSRPYLAWRSSPSGLQRTPENETQPASQESTPPLVLSPEPDDNNKRHINNVEVFNAAHPSQVPLTRTQSQLHVRDIQDQMKGLHIKISSLKVKAQEDNIRRRSFQSLRENSSPGLANPWDSPPRSPPVFTNSKSDWTSEHIREVADEDDEDEHAEEDDGMSVASNKPDSPTIGDPPQISGAYPEESTGYSSGKSSAMGSIYEDAEEGEFDEAEGSSASEADSEALDAILDEPFIEDGQYDEDAEEEEPYPPGQQSDDSKPHEEREDAFDYEHFILHSALGNYTNATKTRRSSDSSTSSTATTRPAQNQSSSLDQAVVGRPRANSAASVSTVQSFATAVEGEEEENDDDMESVLYWDRRFNDGIQRHTPTGHDDHNKQHNGARQQAQTQTIGPASTSLASSLVSTVKAASTTSHGDTKTKPSPVPAAATATAATNNKTLGINNDDTKLLEQLFQSLGKVCMDLQSITSLPDHDLKSARVLRRRLDAARRVLDGELDA